MRTSRKVTAEEENFRIEQISGLPANMGFIKRDPVEPEPVGTIILFAFRITGYDPDCDGSLMARLNHIDRHLMHTGWSPCGLGLYPVNTLVVSENELEELFKKAEESSNANMEVRPLQDRAMEPQADNSANY